ncbi:MAG: hypothetical protein WC236_14920 [Gallionellaceae bacterium]|jgi:hypothetical protein
MAKPITDTLRFLQSGTFIDNASAQLAELVSAVNATGKGGKITLVISVKKMSKGACGVTAEIKLSKPHEAPDATLMFPTEEGDLLTEDPRQQKLELKQVVTGNAAPLKAVGGAS